MAIINTCLHTVRMAMFAGGAICGALYAGRYRPRDRGDDLALSTQLHYLQTDKPRAICPSPRAEPVLGAARDCAALSKPAFLE